MALQTIMIPYAMTRHDATAMIQLYGNLNSLLSKSVFFYNGIHEFALEKSKPNETKASVRIETQSLKKP